MVTWLQICQMVSCADLMVIRLYLSGSVSKSYLSSEIGSSKADIIEKYKNQ